MEDKCPYKPEYSPDRDPMMIAFTINTQRTGKDYNAIWWQLSIGAWATEARSTPQKENLAKSLPATA